ncbi:hypothetical protein QJQ45_014425 [Haematococcus lacustris]|nr:hypothetical protein QJQ45_014425 [Haematococcus lacustris]
MEVQQQTVAKLVLLGEMGSGKSSLVLRYVKGQFFDYQASTVGAAFLTKTIPELNVKFEIWDTAGQERYHSLAPMYYRGAMAAVIVYDITSTESLTRAKSWVKELQRQGNPNLIMALAGNKADLEEQRAVSSEEAAAYAAENNLFFLETSAKTAANVSELFMDIARKLPRVQSRTQLARNGTTALHQCTTGVGWVLSSTACGLDLLVQACQLNPCLSCRGAMAAVIVYDITSTESLMMMWLTPLKPLLSVDKMAQNEHGLHGAASRDEPKLLSWQHFVCHAPGSQHVPQDVSIQAPEAPDAALTRAKSWVKELQRQGNPNLIMALAGARLSKQYQLAPGPALWHAVCGPGNKADLEEQRAVSSEEAAAYAAENNLFFLETSAKTAANVSELFMDIARKLPRVQSSAAGPGGQSGQQGSIALSAASQPPAAAKVGCC